MFGIIGNVAQMRDFFVGGKCLGKCRRNKIRILEATSKTGIKYSSKTLAIRKLRKIC